jgi:hypothetical protein
VAFMIVSARYAATARCVREKVRRWVLRKLVEHSIHIEPAARSSR